jgi:hypothetical protein
MNVVVNQPCLILGTYGIGQPNSGGSGTQGPNIPAGGFLLQIPSEYYDQTVMTRIGTNPNDPRVAACMPWATFIGSTWPYPIYEE